MTKQERKYLEQLAVAMTRCQVLKETKNRKYAIVYSTHALWSILNDNYNSATQDINEINLLIENIGK